jgi:hypothetical protein
MIRIDQNISNRIKKRRFDNVDTILSNQDTKVDDVLPNQLNESRELISLHKKQITEFDNLLQIQNKQIIEMNNILTKFTKVLENITVERKKIETYKKSPEFDYYN